ncbi:MAG: C-GCAxxG-C-C family protein [Chloroflexota bacterium]
MQVMWEAYDLGNEDFLWASAAFRGGIAGRQQGTCGALASAGVCLGLRHRGPIADRKQAGPELDAASNETGELVGSFQEKYGAINCFDLVGVDLSDAAARDRARDEGLFDAKCHQYVQFVVEKLYELDEKRGS